MKAISEFFSTVPTQTELCARSEGIIWEGRQFWLAPRSRYNLGRAPVRLAWAYERPEPCPPEMEVLEIAFAAIEAGITDPDRREFFVQAAIVRAGARQYFAV